MRSGLLFVSIAEVVGSNPSHPVHLFMLWKYGIEMNSFSVIVGQSQFVLQLALMMSEDLIRR
jgi:hypothetical protein